MSEQPAADAPRVPRFDIADRMRKALRTADVSIEDMADYLEVSRRSVGNWINGRADPAPKYVRLWSLRTGVAYEWLCHGDLNPCDLRPRREFEQQRRRSGQDFARTTYMHMLQAA